MPRKKSIPAQEKSSNLNQSLISKVPAFRVLLSLKTQYKDTQNENNGVTTPTKKITKSMGLRSKTPDSRATSNRNLQPSSKNVERLTKSAIRTPQKATKHRLETLENTKSKLLPGRPRRMKDINLKNVNFRSPTTQHAAKNMLSRTSPKKVQASKRELRSFEDLTSPNKGFNSSQVSTRKHINSKSNKEEIIIDSPVRKGRRLGIKAQTENNQSPKNNQKPKKGKYSRKASPVLVSSDSNEESEPESNKQQYWTSKTLRTRRSGDLAIDKKPKSKPQKAGKILKTPKAKRSNPLTEEIIDGDDGDEDDDKVEYTVAVKRGRQSKVQAKIQRKAKENMDKPRFPDKGEDMKSLIVEAVNALKANDLEKKIFEYFRKKFHDVDERSVRTIIHQLEFDARLQLEDQLKDAKLEEDEDSLLKREDDVIVVEEKDVSPPKKAGRQRGRKKKKHWKQKSVDLTLESIIIDEEDKPEIEDESIAKVEDKKDNAIKDDERVEEDDIREEQEMKKPKKGRPGRKSKAVIEQRNVQEQKDEPKLAPKRRGRRSQKDIEAQLHREIREAEVKKEQEKLEMDIEFEQTKKEPVFTPKKEYGIPKRSIKDIKNDKEYDEEEEEMDESFINQQQSKGKTAPQKIIKNQEEFIEIASEEKDVSQKRRRGRPPGSASIKAKNLSKFNIDEPVLAYKRRGRTPKHLLNNENVKQTVNLEIEQKIEEPEVKIIDTIIPETSIKDYSEDIKPARRRGRPKAKPEAMVIEVLNQIVDDSEADKIVKKRGRPKKKQNELVESSLKIPDNPQQFKKVLGQVFVTPKKLDIEEDVIVKSNEFKNALDKSVIVIDNEGSAVKDDLDNKPKRRNQKADQKNQGPFTVISDPISDLRQTKGGLFVTLEKLQNHDAQDDLSRKSKELNRDTEGSLRKPIEVSDGHKIRETCLKNDAKDISEVNKDDKQTLPNGKPRKRMGRPPKFSKPIEIIEIDGNTPKKDDNINKIIIDESPKVRLEKESALDIVGSLNRVEKSVIREETKSLKLEVSSKLNLEMKEGVLFKEERNMLVPKSSVSVTKSEVFGTTEKKKKSIVPKDERMKEILREDLQMFYHLEEKTKIEEDSKRKQVEKEKAETWDKLVKQNEAGNLADSPKYDNDDRLDGNKEPKGLRDKNIIEVEKEADHSSNSIPNGKDMEKSQSYIDHIESSSKPDNQDYLKNITPVKGVYTIEETNFKIKPKSLMRAKQEPFEIPSPFTEADRVSFESPGSVSFHSSKIPSSSFKDLNGNSIERFKINNPISMSDKLEVQNRLIMDTEAKHIEKDVIEIFEPGLNKKRKVEVAEDLTESGIDREKMITEDAFVIEEAQDSECSVSKFLN